MDSIGFTLCFASLIVCTSSTNFECNTSKVSDTTFLTQHCQLRFCNQHVEHYDFGASEQLSVTQTKFMNATYFKLNGKRTCTVKNKSDFSTERSEWRQYLQDNIEWNKKYPMPFYHNRSYQMDVDMPVLVRNYREGHAMYVNKINPYPYKFVNEPSVKLYQTGIFLVFLIKSAPSHFTRRHYIRRTWANMKSTFINSKCIRRIFLIGSTQNENEREQLKYELAKEDDMLQMSFIDTYYNNTLKTIGGLQWIVNSSTSSYVMIVDDDFYIATDFLLQTLSLIPNSQRVFMGHVDTNGPIRYKSKWFVSVNEFPYDMYPAFVSGGAMVFSMGVATDIAIASQYTKPFKFDDVFLGIVTNKLNIPATNNKLFSIGKISYRNRAFWTSIAIHGYKEHELEIAWNRHVYIVCNGVGSGFGIPPLLIHNLNNTR